VHCDLCLYYYYDDCTPYGCEQRCKRITVHRQLSSLESPFTWHYYNIYTGWFNEHSRPPAISSTMRGYSKYDFWNFEIYLFVKTPFLNYWDFLYYHHSVSCGFINFCFSNENPLFVDTGNYNNIQWIVIDVDISCSAYLGFFQGGGSSIFNRHSVYTHIIFILLRTCCIVYNIWSTGGGASYDPHINPRRYTPLVVVGTKFEIWSSAWFLSYYFSVIKNGFTKI